MNMFGYVSDQVSLGFPRFPRLLWDHYVEYLWKYEHNSWVARIASTCRVLAILVSLPIVVLALLDISSYLIARTLGVIDDVKASTTDAVTICQATNTPAISVGSSFQSESSLDDPSGEHRSRPEDSNIHPDSLRYLGASLPRAFYASEDNNLKLSGVGVFSPASSRAVSPVSPRSSTEDISGPKHGSAEALRHRSGQTTADQNYE